MLSGADQVPARALRALCAAAVVASTATAAVAGPYGPELQAGNLVGELQQAAAAGCGRPDGSRIVLRETCFDPDHFDPDGCYTGDLRVEEIDAAGVATGKGFKVLDWWSSIDAAILCGPAGRITVAYTPLLTVQSFDLAGNPLSPMVRLLEGSSFRGEGVRLHTLNGSTFLVVAETYEFYDATTFLGVSTVAVGTFDIHGRWMVPLFDAGPSNELIQFLSTDAASDRDGAAVLAWRPYTPGSDSRSILARELELVASSDVPQPGPVHRMDTSPWGDLDDPSTFVVAPGRFVVAWESSAVGGMIARRFVTEDATITTTTTTTTTSTTWLPAIEPLRKRSTLLDPGSPLRLSAIAADEAATMIAVFSGTPRPWHPLAYLSRSADGGRTWTAPQSIGRSRAVTVNHAGGTWITMSSYSRDGGGGPEQCEITFRRSADAGETWTKRIVRDNLDTSPDYSLCENLQLASAGRDRWVATWRRFDNAETDGNDRYVIGFASSSDDGKTWELGEELASVREHAIGGPRLVVDAGRSWLLLWSDPLRGVTLGSRLGIDAQRWSEPTVTFADPAAATASIMTESLDGWLAAWSTAGGRVDGLGFDADIVVSRSSDRGRTWTPPTALASHSYGDEANDFAPLVARDARGGMLVAWTSHFDLAHDLGTDADVLAAYSGDAGVTWSAPGILDPDATHDVSAESVHFVASDAAAGWRSVWSSTALDTGMAGAIFATTTDGCGDGTLAHDERCDDGNRVDGDGCDSNCTPSGCGNGITTGDEECDDGDSSSHDACLPDCSRPVCGDGERWQGVEECDDGNTIDTDRCLSTCVRARCGDQVVEAGVEDCDRGDFVNGDGCDRNCTFTGCGNGIATAGEDCDDGNRSNQDDCLRDCTVARCGDGFAGVDREEHEQCDDGNPVDTDGCTTVCRRARCGDGLLRAGVEQCDDGNEYDWDDCRSGTCELARCGDGVLNVDAEQCDDGANDNRDECSSTCRWARFDCTDVDDDGVVSSTDASRVLTASIMDGAGCADGDCDVNRDGDISAVDALLVLRAAVGLPAPAACPRAATLTVHLASDDLIALMEFSLDYTHLAGAFVGDGVHVSCRVIGAMDGATFNDDPSRRLLTMSVVAMAGIQGPTDLVECDFAGNDGPSDLPIDLSLHYAQSPSYDFLSPELTLHVE